MDLLPVFGKSMKLTGVLVTWRYRVGIWSFVLCLICCIQSTVHACGYHDPASVQIGGLNWIYPESLHVSGTIWRAQQAGELPWPDTEHLLATGPQRKLLDAAAFEKTSQALHDLGVRMGQMTTDGHTEEFALVLVETGLWTRFAVSRLKQSVAVESDGPGESKLVVVTGDPVLHAMKRGELALSDAVESGLVKLYGEPEQIDGFVASYGTLGGQAPALAEN